MLNNNNNTLMNNSQMSNYMNMEICKRNVPSQQLQPHLSVYPVSTKYELFPTLNKRKESCVVLEQHSSYNVSNVFNPGTKKPPSWSDYVNVESELRNQIYGLSKGSKSVYVPKSNSDLYYYNFKQDKNEDYDKILNRKENFNLFNPNIDNLGNQLFHNNTRIQLKNKSK